jgi:3-oxoacyl-[acyl-carrier protein] reductase
MSKEKRVGLITGVSQGLGKFLAKYYCDQGHTVFGCSRSKPEWEHENLVHLSGDVTKEADVKSMALKIREQSGHLDFLINNAGIAAMNHTILTPYATAQNVMNTNFLGTFLVSREGARLLQKSKIGGRIVNFSTIAVPLNLDGEAVYAASKAAVETLTKVMAKELANMEITVNAVAPTPVKTNLIRNVPEDKIKELLNKQAIKRMGEPEDVANVIDFFLDSKSNFITGQIVYLGGVTT